MTRVNEATEEIRKNRPTPGTPEFEWLKFEDPAACIVDDDSGYPPGAQGTPWERHYKALALSDADARAQGLPSHESALAELDASAAQSNAQTQRHKVYTLCAKLASEGSRPDEATAALRQWFGALLERESASRWGTMPAPVLPFEGESWLTTHRDIAYDDDPAMQCVDVYLPRSDRPTPVLLEIHGGGWRRGSRRGLEAYKGDLFRKVLEAGIAVVAVEYRLAPRHRFPSQMLDAARAVQFVRHKAKEWNIDPDRISAIGGSAGGHLLTWVALHDDLAKRDSADPVARESSRLTCFIIQWAPVDLFRFHPMDLLKQGAHGADVANAMCSVFGFQYDEYNDPRNADKVRDASPLFHLTPDDPPGMIMFGGAPEDFDLDNHPPVPDDISDPHSYLHGVILADAMKKAGVSFKPYIGSWVGKDAERDVAEVIGFLKESFGM